MNKPIGNRAKSRRSKLESDNGRFMNHPRLLIPVSAMRGTDTRWTTSPPIPRLRAATMNSTRDTICFPGVYSLQTNEGYETTVRFFLDVLNGIGTAVDDEGMELPDLASARQNAIEGIRSIVAAEASSGKIDLQGRVEIFDENRVLRAVVPYRDAFELLLGE